jgi:hypothetical protein
MDRYRFSGADLESPFLQEEAIAQESRPAWDEVAIQVESPFVDFSDLVWEPSEGERAGEHAPADEEFSEATDELFEADVAEESEGLWDLLNPGTVVERVKQWLKDGAFNLSLLGRFATGQVWNEDHLALEVLFHRQPRLRPAKLDKATGLPRLALLNSLAVKHLRALAPIRERIVRPVFGNPANFQVGSAEYPIRDLREVVRKLGPLPGGKTAKGVVWYKRQANLSPRPESKVDAIVLHHMAFNRGNDLSRYEKVGAHYVVLADGQIAQLYDDLDYLNASDGFNGRSVAIEFAGNFSDERYHWWKDRDRTIPDRCYLTPAEIRAGRCLLKAITTRLPGVKYVYAHRQSSKDRTGDPGPDVWCNVGEWAISNLKLTDRLPTTHVGSGRPVPDSWRTARSIAADKELAGDDFVDQASLLRDEGAIAEEEDEAAIEPSEFEDLVDEEETEEAYEKEPDDETSEETEEASEETEEVYEEETAEANEETDEEAIGKETEEEYAEEEEEEGEVETASLIDGETPVWRSGTEYFRDAASGRDQVGIQRDDGRVFLAVASDGSTVTTLASARVGTLHLNPTRPVHRLRPVQLDAVSGGSTGALRAKFTGPRVVALPDGIELLRTVGTKYEAVAATALPETLRGQLAHGTRLEIDQGMLRVWMVFRVRGESADKARWVPAKKTRTEITARRDALVTALARIPAGALRTSIDTHLDTLAVVSAIEGGFGSKSGAGDTHASLGIFQWAMKRDQWQETGSLGKFFRDLKVRAQAGTAAGAGSLFVDAWAECTAKGLDVLEESGRWVLSLNGTKATGSQVETKIHSVMSAGNLASYQLVASLDWIREFQQTVVWPGPLGVRLTGHKWRIVTSPTKAQLTSGRRSLTLETTAVTRLSQVFTSQAALATAVMLGVNRPAFVPLALWRALGTPGDPSARVGQLLTAVFDACTAAGQNPGSGTFTRAHVTAAGAAAETAWEALRAFIWPAASVPAGGEAEVRATFERKALWLYEPGDARRFKREGRFATVRVLLP